MALGANNGRGLRTAAKDLRNRLKMTMTVFAAEIGKTVPTILRYETNVPPRGPALVPYAELAIANGFDDLAKTFCDAILEENGQALRTVITWSTQSTDGRLNSQGHEPLSPAVSNFLNSSSSNRRLLDGFCKFMSASDLRPIEELVRESIKQILVEQRSADRGKSAKNM